MPTTCLIGNGLSIAYNPLLSTGELTTGLLSAFGDNIPGGGPHPLAGFAEALRGSDTPPTFEELLAPLEWAANALPHLRRLSSSAILGSGAEVESALTTTVSFLLDVHTRGMGTTLELIATRAKGEGREQFERVVVRVCRALAGLRNHGSVTVATLNYDGLLHAGFQELQDEPDSNVDFCDLAAGYGPTVRMPARDIELTCHALRNDDNFPSKTRLLNLHGSLGWLRDPASGLAWKFALDDLRGMGPEKRSYWDYMRNGEQALEPLVVLTDRKSAAVIERPFSLAYEIFERQLGKSRHWLIAGYSFHDEPVNRALARALERMVDDGREPGVLVVGSSGAPESLARMAIEILAAPAGVVSADTTGFPEVVDSEAWRRWARADRGG